MNQKEKQVITTLSVVILVVAVMFVYSWVKTGNTSTSESGQMDSIKENMKDDTAQGSSDTEASNTESASQATTTEQENTTSTIKASESTETTKATDAKTVMDADDGYMFPDVDTSYISASAIKKLTTEQIQYAINEVYARKGLKFTKKKNKERFEKKAWYTGTVDEQDDISLNQYEKKNVDTMAAELKKRGVR